MKDSHGLRIIRVGPLRDVFANHDRREPLSGAQYISPECRMMRELTLANAMQNIRVMKYLYMAIVLGSFPWRWSLAIVLGASPVAVSTISQSPGNVSYLTPDSSANSPTRRIGRAAIQERSRP
jgi:hypothetical protein